MCQFKSGIILKDRVFVLDYDSHTDILEELGIADTRANAERLFVRAELIPKNGDVFSDISEWSFRVDQDIVPDWFVAEYEKERMIEAVKAWAKDRIFVGVDSLVLEGGNNFYVKDCKNVSCANSTVTASGNSTVTAWDNSTVTARGNSTVTARGNSTVTAWGNSTVIKDVWSSFDTDRLVLSENSTFKDCVTRTLYQSGDFKLVTVTDGKIR